MKLRDWVGSRLRATEMVDDSSVVLALLLNLSISRCGVMSLTAAMEGFFPSPAGGWVTSAPRNITGCWNTNGLEHKSAINTQHKVTADVCPISEMIHIRISPPESSLTCPAGGGCYWHRPAWRWSSDRGWRGSEVLSFEHSSLGHIAWPCRVLCLQHVSPQLHNTAGQ